MFHLKYTGARPRPESVVVRLERGAADAIALRDPMAPTDSDPDEAAGLRVKDILAKSGKTPP